MKALVLAAGRGSRLSEKTQSINKCMIVVKEKPILYYNLTHIQNLSHSVSEIIIVVGYKKETIIQYFGYEFSGIPITYIYQDNLNGVVSAIDLAKNQIGNENFMLMFGDELIYKPQFEEMCHLFKNDRLDGICGVIAASSSQEISKTYTVDIDCCGYIKNSIEKPLEPYNNLRGTGYCLFSNDLLKYISQTQVNHTRNQKELCDWLNLCIENDMHIKACEVGESTVNVNQKEDLLIAEKLIDEQ